jgi:hypothetical protein
VVVVYAHFLPGPAKGLSANTAAPILFHSLLFYLLNCQPILSQKMGGSAVLTVPSLIGCDPGFRFCQQRLSIGEIVTPGSLGIVAVACHKLSLVCLDDRELFVSGAAGITALKSVFSGSLGTRVHRNKLCFAAA